MTELEKPILRLTKEAFEALPTLQQLHDQGLQGRDIVNRKYRASSGALKVFKKIVEKSEFRTQGKVVVTKIWDVELI